MIQNLAGPPQGGSHTALGVTGSQVIKGSGGTLWSVNCFTLGTTGANGGGGNFYDSATVAGVTSGYRSGARHSLVGPMQVCRFSSSTDSSGSGLPTRISASVTPNLPLSAGG